MGFFTCCALQWKFFNLKKRHWCSTLMELFTPTFLFVFLVYILNVGFPRGRIYSKGSHDFNGNKLSLYPDQLCRILEEDPIIKKVYYTNKPIRYSGQTNKHQLILIGYDGRVGDFSLIDDIIKRINSTLTDSLLPYCNKMGKGTFSIRNLGKKPLE